MKKECDMLDVTSLDITIKPGKCKVWEVVAKDIESQIGDNGCLQIIFKTSWENDRIPSITTYVCDLPMPDLHSVLCCKLVLSGDYPQYANVGLIFCGEEDLPDENEVYWATEYKNGKKYRGGWK